MSPNAETSSIDGEYLSLSFLSLIGAAQVRCADGSIYPFPLGGSGWDLVDLVGWPRQEEESHWWAHSLWEPPNFTALAHGAPELVGGTIFRNY